MAVCPEGMLYDGLEQSAVRMPSVPAGVISRHGTVGTVKSTTAQPTTFLSYTLSWWKLP